MSEPVGMLQEDALGRGQVFWFNKPEDNTYLYTHPMRELSNEEIMEVANEVFNTYQNWGYYQIDFAREILRKASEK
jgi:hypothetical protein